ncbi:MAG TPA: formate transporter FocA [Phycisphaerales bacterium]|nr:formate transporter FocA [Phycisphaerales bacterium]
MSDLSVIPRVLRPPAIAEKVVAAGARSARLDLLTLTLLGLLGGAFIALAANLYTVTMTGSAALPFGVAKLLGGLSFCLGLVLVVIAGAELFTGNNMSLVMAVASRQASAWQLLRGWTIVYVTNFVGSVAIAWLMVQTGQGKFAGGEVAQTAVDIARAKCALSWTEAFARGVVCNMLVCLAIWVCYSAHSTTDRILGILFPITAFVAAGFEHSVANMYFVPAGLFANTTVPPGALTWGNFLLRNLLPVTLGNIVGGGVLVGLMYWLIYCRPRAGGAEI